MPTIIPTIQRPAISPNANAEIVVSGNVTIAQNDILYSRAANIRLYWANHNSVDEFLNRGTVWNYSTENVSSSLAGFYIDRIYNFGLIGAESDSGNAFGVGVSASGRIVDNSGTIYAFSRSGQAHGLYHYGGDVRVTNSGLIAAHTLAGGIENSSGALGFAAYNGGTLHNTATGRILAEGDWAVAVSFGRGGSIFNLPVIEILNDGLIEAVTFLAQNRSIGIRAAHLDVEPMRIVNNGVIRADLAIAGGSSSWPESPAGEVVTNNASGQIYGDVELNLGNDQFLNAGLLQGVVRMGNGDDVFTNSGTSWTGHADLGWGDDVFSGSGQTEYVMGGRGADRLTGNGGNDLLLGGVGRDIIDGGTGNDTIYGEYDDDVIRILEGDRVFGGSGDDRIEAGDLAFASIDGGSGYDVLVLPTGSGTLDIGSVMLSGRVTDIEEIELLANRNAALMATDLQNLVATPLRVSGAANAMLTLVGAWEQNGTTIQNGISYRVMASGGRSLYVNAALPMTVQMTAPTDLVAISAIAGGVPAVDLASQSRVALSSNIFNNAQWSLTEDLVIDREEIWTSQGDYPVLSSFLSSATITNYGRITHQSSTNLSHAVRITNLGLFDNYGTIESITTGQAYAGAYIASSYGPLRNSGFILAQAVDGEAMAVSARSAFGFHETAAFQNTGRIRATSQTSAATGVQISGLPNGFATNDGNILAEGGTTVWAVHVDRIGSFVNRGEIIARQLTQNGSGAAVAIFLSGPSYSSSTVENYGRLQGEIAITADDFQGGTAINFRNHQSAIVSGQIVGMQTNDNIYNRGVITGAIRMGAGDDVYDGFGGTQTGGIFGGMGNDLYRVDGQSVLLYENLGEGTDTVESSANYYLFANIENLILTGTTNIFGVGNELANELTGNSGENLLIAGAGNDTVNGGGARDAIFGEDGADILNGEAGVDYIVGGIGNDSIDGGADADELYGQDGDDIMRGGTSFDTDIMVGGLGNDTIYGNSGLGDYDLLYGNQGNDVFYVDTPADLVFEQAGEGTDTVYADINGAGYYLYDNIENLVLLDDTPFGVGNALDNRLTGNAVGNYLLGGAGNDRLNGMTGNDVLFGEAGNDVFVFDQGTGGDVIGDFTIGQDRMDLSAYGLTFTQLQTLFAQNGNVGAIQFANGDVIVLHNVTMSQLTASDFILTPVAEGPPKTEADVMDVVGAFDEGATSALFADLPYADSGLERWGQLQGGFFV